MTTFYQVGITHCGQPVTTLEDVAIACNALGFVAVDVEEVQADVGCWMLTLPVSVATRLEQDGSIVLIGGGYALEGEMP